MSETQQRMDAIESKLAFQEDTITALNDALVAQQVRIDELEQMLKMTLAQLDGASEPAEQIEPPPPHY